MIDVFYIVFEIINLELNGHISISKSIIQSESRASVKSILKILLF